MLKVFIESTRNNVTPKEFFRYCKMLCAKKGVDIESYISYDGWLNPSVKCNTTYKHDEWETPLYEKNKYMELDTHLYLQDTYNFILEFSYENEKVGSGYFHIVEYMG